MAYHPADAVEITNELHVLGSVVHDLDREQLELRDLVRNSAINRTI
jgi:hypothetical protein